MITLTQILKEVKDAKTLYAFDLDDTLVVSKSEVLVNNEKTGKKFKLTPAEFAVYEPQPDDNFDFSEFSTMRGAEVIKKNFDTFSNILKRTSTQSQSKTIILTARPPEITSDLKAFLKKKGLPNLTIQAVGDSNPKVKADVIQKYIDQGFNKVYFYDDSRKNVMAVLDLKKTNPNVAIKAKLVRGEF